MTPSLFRDEAVNAQRQRLYGDVIVARPLSFTVISGFLGVILLVLVAFLATGSYARKETAGGYLQPDKGVVEIVAPVGGVLETVHVLEGDVVREVAKADVLADHGPSGSVELVNEKRTDPSLSPPNVQVQFSIDQEPDPG